MVAAMIDREGYRPNVGIILCNTRNQVFWGKRVNQHAWQFPQGGINAGETPEQAMFRELEEEVGLQPAHVRILGRTREWLRYDVPPHWTRRDSRGLYRGQKQIWFLLRLTGRDCDVSLRASSHPEFDAWRSRNSNAICTGMCAICGSVRPVCATGATRHRICC